MPLNRETLITMEDIRRIPNAEFYNVNFRSAKSVSTDSRTVSAGEIFFALRGETFDGHYFVPEVVGKKASCAVVDRKWYSLSVGSQASVAGYPLAVVDDTTRALGDLANLYRRKFSMPVIAIGGSNGKTTTKEMAARVLSQKMRVVRTSGNHNNQIGVPLTIFKFKKNHEVAVVEIGTNHFGEIERLCEILEPDAGLITNIGAEHLEFFRNLSGVTKEESMLFDFLKNSGGLSFVNADDANILSMKKSGTRKFTYGFRAVKLSHRNISGKFFGLDGNGCAMFEVRCDGSKGSSRDKTELIRLRVPGIHNAMNALAAAAIGCRYGLSLLEIKRELENYRSYEKRMQLVEVGGIRILNDTYNSNPESAFAAIRWLSDLRAEGKKIAVLADMLELGNSSTREHRKIGKEIAKTNLNFLFTYGKRAEEIAAAAESHSNRKKGKVTIEVFEEKQKLLNKLLRTVSAGDVILVKGSRGMKMEEIVNALMTDLNTDDAGRRT